MIGLREYARDLALPARLGEPDLVASDEAEIVELVGRVLGLPDGPRPVGAHCTFARWKAGTSITAGYEVALSNGEQRRVTLKRYRGDKAESISESYDPDRYARDPGACLAPYGVDAGGRAALYAFPVDRVLPGVARVLDLRRTSHQVDRAGLFEPWVVRRRASNVHVLRYKPERRAVLRLELKLRDGGEGRARRDVIARVLPPDHAALCVARRRELEARGELPVPRLLLAEGHSGILFEEFLDLAPADPTCFADVRAAGELLARLHALPTPDGTAPRGIARRSRLLECVPALAARARRVPIAVASERTTWIHGDFHPDQVVRSADGESVHLIDLDELAVGDPLDDLASWVADELQFEAATTAHAGCDLLDAYAAAGGEVPDAIELSERVADTLVRRAEAGLRRLEVDADQRAEHLLELALELSARAKSGASPAPLGDQLEQVAAFVDGGMRGVSLVRIESDPDHRRVLRVRVAGDASERVFLFDEHGPTELDPTRDERVRVSRLLSGEGEPIEEILAWRPGRRMALRASSGRVVKGYRARRSRRAVLAHERAAEAAGRSILRVPRLLSTDPENERMDLELLPGAPLTLGPGTSETFFRFGHGLRQLQDARPLPELAEHGVTEELHVIDTLEQRVAGVYGAEPSGWADARQRLGARAERLPAEGWVLTHRDLHDGQILDGDGELALLDFDLLCLADPALDPANLTAHLTLRALQGVREASEGSVAEACEALLDGLDRGADPGFHERLRFFQAATFLRLSLVYSLRPPWASLVPELVRLSSRCLDEIPTR